VADGRVGGRGKSGPRAVQQLSGKTRRDYRVARAGSWPPDGLPERLNLNARVKVVRRARGFTGQRPGLTVPVRPLNSTMILFEGTTRKRGRRRRPLERSRRASARGTAWIGTHHRAGAGLIPPTFHFIRSRAALTYTKKTSCRPKPNCSAPYLGAHHTAPPPPPLGATHHCPVSSR
jgi:hypothetical protein